MMGGPFRAVVAATAAAGIGITAFGERYLLIGTVAAIGALFSIGWPSLLGLPARRGASVVLLGCVVASVGVLLLTNDLAMVAVVFALSVVAAFVHELVRRDGRPRLVESVSGTVAGAAVVTSATGWIAVGTGPTAVGLLLCGAVTLAVAAMCSALPFPGWIGAGITVVAAAGGGLAVGSVTDVGPTAGALIGFSAGVVLAAAHRLFGQFPSSGRPFPALAAAVLPVAVAGLPVYVLARLLVA
ncbi:hypothetical protein EXU48_23450 [Occultella glacieicola]|uniref:Uncharacterized protein n=1 Tax=Occultella glacieicola TaxID=2518684 RepID=A0ABY2DXT6_9MICO|nr:hypothetical protein [Occultella glacieicola]TDE88334.1 hypothetical protein EXU48_23450 [Occultella glacieicola]